MRRAALALLACLLLAGCTAPPIQIEIVDEGGRKIVGLYYRWFFGLRSSEWPCVRALVIADAGSLDERGAPEEIWRAESTDPHRQCTRLSRFEFGRTPPGFAERLNRLPAPLRGRYRLDVQAIGQSSIDIVY